MACKDVKSKEFEEKYLKMMEEELPLGKKMVSAKDWTLYKEAEDSKLYYRTFRDSAFYMYKAVIDIKNCKPEEFFEYYFAPSRDGDFKTLKECAPTTKSMTNINEFEKNKFYAMCIGVHANSMIVSDREFFVCRIIEKSPARIILLSVSVKDEDEKLHPVDEKQSHVRGKMYMMLDIQKRGRGIVVSNLLHTDPKGNIPSVVYNNVATSSALSILGYKNCFLKQKK